MPEKFVHVQADTRPTYWFVGTQFRFIVTTEESGAAIAR